MKHDHRITKVKALEMIRRREARVLGEAERGKGRVVGTPADIYLGGTFDKQIILDMLNQPGAEGLGIYRADHADGSPAHVLVAVDANSEDMTDIIAEIERPCPPFCRISGVLGSGA